MAALPCPVCAGSLTRISVTDVDALHGCRECGGVWIDWVAAERVRSGELSSHALVLATELDARSRKGHREPGGVYRGAGGARRCPACRQRLRRTETALASVEIDTCRDHGAWFDRTELVRLNEAARFERVRARELVNERVRRDGGALEGQEHPLIEVLLGFWDSLAGRR